MINGGAMHVDGTANQCEHASYMQVNVETVGMSRDQFAQQESSISMTTRNTTLSMTLDMEDMIQIVYIN